MHELSRGDILMEILQNKKKNNSFPNPFTILQTKGFLRVLSFCIWSDSQYALVFWADDSAAFIAFFRYQMLSSLKAILDYLCLVRFYEC